MPASIPILLHRIADALERLAPPPPQWPPQYLDASAAWIWDGAHQRLHALAKVNRLPLELLCGIDSCKSRLHSNTLRFGEGLSANNALLWGARGMGKTSLIKAIHGDLIKASCPHLKLIEVQREDIASLSLLIDLLRDQSMYRIVLFCDDLSFEQGDSGYKSLKVVLDGGLAGRPSHILFYATSNRRHLIPREMIENESATAINPGEAGEEKTALSERFGLWLGFHSCSQAVYLDIIDHYVRHYGLPIAAATLHDEAVLWARTRGSRSGRIAWQFVLDLAARLRISLD